jgi:hypothetical protein
LALADADGEEGRLDQKGLASGLRIFTESTVLSATISDTSPTGETIRRSIDACATRRHRITEVSLSQRLVAGDQAH